jgi:hypothetical protein
MRELELAVAGILVKNRESLVFRSPSSSSDPCAEFAAVE